ncbi:MAG: histone deacetylase [Fischerella sp.]|jgi:acetoin utilization deacetylase AcuC-like enzyme|uniref:histone deacetylase family protein n=1 Tax=Fischerella sp. TaxID=1191 RepID=UPI00180B4454|nr:histone deacetylase [Fischerella sp.]NWF62091.1 histone deacetylase [Fischerella sp.]
MLPIIYSDEFLLHDTGYFHPEKPERLTAIKNALKAAPWTDQIEWKTPTPVDQRDPMLYLQRVHDPSYINGVRALSNRGGGQIDSDTVVSPRTYEVALLAVSAWLDGVDSVLTTGEPAFVLARPPGHHALREVGMGFCIFNNEACAASYALDHPGVNRIAILDWDVHHGNGTQTIVQGNPRIAYCSLHQFPLFPGTGNTSEHGKYNNVLNLPMLPGSTMADYQPLFEHKVIPFLSNFQPDLLIVSAGYDATEDDPLANMRLQPEDYGVFTKYCLQLTRRILFGLEGGYDLNSLGRSVVATIESCLMNMN